MEYSIFESLIQQDFVRKIDETTCFFVSRDGAVFKYKKNKVKKLNIKPCKTGYVLASLYDNGLIKVKSVHRLVAQAFIPNPKNLEIINHKDENPSNNCVDNLEWCTRSYNALYNGASKRAGIKKRRRIARIDTNGKILEIYNSVTDAINDGFHGANISHCARNILMKKDSFKKYRDHKGYYWRYVDRLSSLELALMEVSLP